MTDADDLVLLASTPTQAESLLHSLEQAAKSIGLYVNWNKRVYTFGTRSHFDLKWQASEIQRPVHIDRQQYLIYWKQCQYMHSEAWTAIDRLSITRKSDLSDKIKHDFF